MNAHSEAVTEQIRSAMQSSNPRDVVTGVKEAVAHEVTALSPDADIEVTDYFNHSYMPDLVVHWNEAGKPDERPIFLRNSLRPAVIEHELQTLAPREPVVLSLTASTERSPRFDALRAQARQTNRALVTDVASLADVAALGSRPDQGDEPEGVGAPLLRLVQANLLKGGRGLLTSEDAERLTRSVAPADEGGLTDEFLSAFEESADELFVPDAALRLRRAAELLRFGLSPDVAETLPLSGGQLSDVELRVLLPYLLSDPTASSKLALWTSIGSMMSLERLEDIGELLADVDISALVVPNVEAWAARRAQLVFNNEYDEDQADEHGTTGLESSAPSWRVRNRMLTADAGRWRLFVTTKKGRLRGRTDSTAALWDDISPRLREFALDAVDLRGVSRRILVSAEETGDVRADVALIRETIDDSFHVPNVHVRRLGDTDPASSMKVDFTEMTSTADRGAPVASFVAAAGLLGYRWPADFSALVTDSPSTLPDSQAP